VEHGPAGVAAGVDARHDDVGRVAEPAQAGGQDAQAGRAVDRIGRHPRQAGQLDLVGVDVLVDVDLADGGPGPAHVAVRRHHQGLVAGLDQGPGEGVQPRRLDPVVVGDQHLHRRPSAASSSERPRRALVTSVP
jgi:hypothetical protein